MSAELPRDTLGSTIGVSVDRARRRGSPRRPRWQGHLALALRLTLFVIAAAMLRHEVAGVDRAELVRALRSYGWAHVALGVLCTVASFLTLGAVELLALRYAGRRAAHAVPRSAALTTAFVSHAFSQSVGLGLLTGTAVRLRAYADHGVDALAVARASAFVTATVVLGLLAVGSVALMIAPPALHVIHIAVPERRAGVLLAAIVLAYVAWTGFGKHAGIGSGRWHVPHPSLAFAMAQVVLSAFDWLATGMVLFALLPVGLSLSYIALLKAYLVAQMVGMASHVPGGAGVFEVALLGLLAPGLSGTMRNGLVGSLIAYRVLYYLVPLGAATMVAAVVEVRRSRRIASSSLAERVRSLPSQPRSGYALPLLTAAPPEPARAQDAPLSAGSAAHRPEWLIDNADAYDRVLHAIRTARRSVWITQLAFDADCVIYARDADHERACSPTANQETILAETLIAIASSAPVDVRILLNATVLLDTARPLRRFFAERMRARSSMAGRIRVRGVRHFPNFLHLKMVIVDGHEAFLLGSPFVNSYWDDARHPPVDTRRPMRELSGRPLHDVSLRIAGGAVAHLESIFAELWNDATTDATTEAPDNGTVQLPLVNAERDWRTESVQVVRTMPRRVLRHAPDGVTEVFDALLDGIERARSLIYVEHQYLTARPVVAALVSALRRRPELELVIVLNENPDLTAYRGWQNARLAESGLLEHPRVGVYSLWSAAPSRSRPGVSVLNQVFVHSKVITVDDTWAMVGAANLDGLSLYSYGDDFTGRVARRIFRHVRNFEVSVVVRDDVGDLRTRLWSEHLGLPACALAPRPPGGWLPLWRARAGANVAALNAGANLVRGQPHMRGFALPYSTRLTPVQQLTDLGVQADPARLDVRFDPGWLDVRFSLGWVRNMLE